MWGRRGGNWKPSLPLLACSAMIPKRQATFSPASIILRVAHEKSFDTTGRVDAALSFLLNKRMGGVIACMVPVKALFS